MGAHRIRIAKDKAELVKALTSSEGSKAGPFPTYADVILFAAALGARHKKRLPVGEISKREPGPIEEDIFVARGYDMVIKLLAIVDNKDAQIISSEVKYSERRIHIFEEYANGGLEILRDELRGAVDYTERLLLMLMSERVKDAHSEEEFDLSRFLS
ncbi:MAG: DNA phosphorothioation-associated protein 4 [Oscillatoria princeps RMCB-10]|jgi:dnd system-associated protein 4|nr:DNA phosphorothioation-associated protein 4 [Oscillatoria princeps RMCB-10]